MKHLIRIFLLSMFAFIIGCYETTTQYIVNPDGSGKVIVEVKAASIDMGVGTGKSNGAKDLAKDVIKKSTGIDTWKDVEVKILDDGKNYFKGTGYFPDLNKVKFKNISMADSIQFYKDAQNRLVLKIGGEKETAGGTASNKSMTQEELDKAIKEQKAGYQQMKPMLGAFLATMRTDMTFQLPGTIEKTTNMKKDKDGRVSVSFEGQKLMDALDKLMADEMWVKQQAMAGAKMKDSPPSGDDLNEKIFGEKGPVRAIAKGKFLAFFDYQQEKAAAEKNYDAIIAALGIEAGGAAAEAPVENYKGGNFKSIKIAKAAISDMPDPDYTLFGDDRSYQVTFVAELPGAVMKVDKVKVTKAVTDNGEDLMPESDWNRETTWADLSKNKNFVKWSFTLGLPTSAAQGIKEISGNLYCQVAGKTKTVDTGIKKFEHSATGNELGAVIDELQSTDCRIIHEVEDERKDE